MLVQASHLVCHLTFNILKFNCICNYLSALNYFLKEEGSAPIDYDSFDVKTVLHEVKHQLGCAMRRVAPHLLNIY